MKSTLTLILLILVSCKCSTVKKDAGEGGVIYLTYDHDTTNIIHDNCAYGIDTTEEPYNPKQILYDSNTIEPQQFNKLIFDSCNRHTTPEYQRYFDVVKDTGWKFYHIKQCDTIKFGTKQILGYEY